MYRLVQLRSKAARQLQNYQTDADSDSEYGDESDDEACASDVADCPAMKPTVNLLERDESNPLIRKFERDLWVVNGVLSQGLDRALLEKVSKNFQRIDCVPSGYYYPELFARPIEQLAQ